MSLWPTDTQLTLTLSEPAIWLKQPSRLTCSPCKTQEMTPSFCWLLSPNRLCCVRWSIHHTLVLAECPNQTKVLTSYWVAFALMKILDVWLNLSNQTYPCSQRLAQSWENYAPQSKAGYCGAYTFIWESLVCLSYAYRIFELRSSCDRAFSHSAFNRIQLQETKYLPK